MGYYFNGESKGHWPPFVQSEDLGDCLAISRVPATSLGDSIVYVEV